MELQVGQIYSNSDLAEWFGIKVDSFRKSKKRKLEVLSEFAEFEVVGNKILITNVFEPVYIKNYKIKKNDAFYIEKTTEVIQENPIQTCINITEIIRQRYPNELIEMHHNSKGTSYYYVRKNVKEMFIGVDGKPPTHGIFAGWVWCKKIYVDELKYHLYIPMTEEEYEDWVLIRKSCQTKVDENYLELERQYDDGAFSEAKFEELAGKNAVQHLYKDSRKIFLNKYYYPPVEARKFYLSAF